MSRALRSYLNRAAQAYAYLGRPGAPRPVLSLSGGKDSGALYLFLCYLAGKYGFAFEAVFADTGNEHPLTLEYIHDLPCLAGGPEIITVKADFTEDIAKRRQAVAKYPPEMARLMLPYLRPTGVPYLDMCLSRGRFPSDYRRFCTGLLKTAPINEYQYSLLDAGYFVESWVGVRAEESLKRARYAKRLLIDQGIWVVRPILRWKIPRVLKIHNYFNVPLNPLYKMGMSRVGCYPCIYSKKSDIFQISRRFPEHIEKIRQWEALVNLVSKSPATFFHKKGRDSGLTGIDGIVRWSKTTHGGRQYDLCKTLPVPACQSEYGLCE